jgi:hypothetical protein
MTGAAVLAAVALTRGPVAGNVTPRTATITFSTSRPVSATVTAGGRQWTAGTGTTHLAQLTGLRPGTRMAYRLVAGSAALGSGSFPSAPARPSTFTFAVVGDYGEPGPAEAGVARLIGSWHPDFVLTTGDNAYPLGVAGLLDADIFRPYATVMRESAWFPALGNHDIYITGGRDELAAFHISRWYRFGWGQVSVTVLDSDWPVGPGSPQLQFAARSLGVGSCFRFAAWHHPPWSPHSAGIAPALRQNIVPLVERAKAQVVFLGHVHSYERSVVHHGVTYVTVGTGGAAIGRYGVSTLRDARLITNTFGALRVDVSGRVARFRFFDVKGRVLDRFTRRC